jgi:hypothetical protein
MLYEATPSHISYKKDSTDTVEEKFILPTRVPSPLITAIDVGHLDEADVVKLTQLQRDYKEYVSNFISTMFKFEDWVEQTTGVRPNLKWRTYKVENVLKSD